MKMQIKIGTFIFISNIQKVGEALTLNENLKKLWPNEVSIIMMNY